MLGLINLAFPKLDILGSKFLSSKTHPELILRCTTCKSQIWWSQDKPLATPRAILILWGHFNVTSLSKGCYHFESLPFDMYWYTRILSFPSTQNPSRGTIFLCLYLPKILISKRNCLLNSLESNSLLIARFQPFGNLPLYIIPIFPIPMALSMEKQSVASLTSLSLIVDFILSVTTEICWFHHKY